MLCVRNIYVLIGNGFIALETLTHLILNQFLHFRCYQMSYDAKKEKKKVMNEQDCLNYFANVKFIFRVCFVFFCSLIDKKEPAFLNPLKYGGSRVCMCFP